MKNSKFQIPSSKEVPGLKPPTVSSQRLQIGSWNVLKAWSLDFGALFACAACYGKSDSPLASGMNAGIFTLLGVVLTVLTCFALFFVHVLRAELKPPADKPESTNPKKPTNA